MIIIRRLLPSVFPPKCKSYDSGYISVLDNQKQSRIANLLPRTAGDAYTVEILDAKCQSVITLLACLLVTPNLQIHQTLKIQVGIFHVWFLPKVEFLLLFILTFSCHTMTDYLVLL